MYPYAAYYNFFAQYFGNVFFLAFAFLLWVAITVTWYRILRRKPLWLIIPLTFTISIVHYLVFGLLFAPGYFGGEAEFLYDPTHIRENIYLHGGWQLIALWPLYLLTTGGILIVLPVVIFGLGFWYSRSRKEASGEKQGGQVVKR